MGRNQNVKTLGVLISILMLQSFPALAARQCSDLFFGDYRVQRPARTELQQLAQEYPQFMENVRIAKQSILDSNFTMEPITDVQQISARTSIRGRGNPSSLAERNDAVLNQTVVNVFNDLVNKRKMANYVEKLMIDAGIYMLRNKQNRTREVQDPNRATSQYAPNSYTTKEEFLKRGRIDHHSVLYILSHRIRARGENIAYILPNGNYSGNSSRTQRYETFFQVPRRGPFIDGAFGRASSHGQDVHLVQMDYISETLAKSTNNNPKIFWDYALHEANDSTAGTWVWDTFFDGMNGTFMHPEFLGPKLQQHLPVH